MKKTLLLAAVAALSMNAMAQDASEFEVTKVWSHDVSTALTKGDARQGVGINGVIYINVKGESPQVVGYNADGQLSTTLNGTTNCGINRDDAGNLILSAATFPGNWVADSALRIVNPETRLTKVLSLTEDCLPSGRCDFLGKASGNMMQNGELLLAGANDATNICVVTVKDGDLDADNSYKATADGVSPITSTTICDYDDYALYVTRNANPLVLWPSGDNYSTWTFTLPDKGACNGMELFEYENNKYFLYPTTENYFDGWAIARMVINVDGTYSAEQVYKQEATVTANGNGFQGNWLNAEYDEASNTINIYQYYPGGYVAMYTFKSKETAVKEVNAARTEVAKTYVNLQGMQSAEPFNGFNIVVTSYSDGTTSSTKVIK